MPNLSKAQIAMLRKALIKDYVTPRGGSEHKTAGALARRGYLVLRGAGNAYFITDAGRSVVK